MAKTLAEDELRRLARLGAIARLKEIEAEAAAIRRAFPGLGGVAQTPKARAPEKRVPRKGRMSPEAREAARRRMQEYWAKKKAVAADAAAGGGADDQPSADASARPRRPRESTRLRARKTR